MDLERALDAARAKFHNLTRTPWASIKVDGVRLRPTYAYGAL